MTKSRAGIFAAAVVACVAGTAFAEKDFGDFYTRAWYMVVDNPGGEEDWRVGVRFFAGSRPEAELVVRGEKTETSDRFSLEL